MLLEGLVPSQCQSKFREVGRSDVYPANRTRDCANPLLGKIKPPCDWEGKKAASAIASQESSSTSVLGPELPILTNLRAAQQRYRANI